MGKLQVDLHQRIPQHSFVTASDEYAKHSLLPADQMRKLLLQLGASDHIAVPEATVTLTAADKPKSAWAHFDLGPAPDGGWSICDHSGAEFEAVVHSVLTETGDVTQTLNSLDQLAHILSSRWEAHHKHCLTATCTQVSGNAAPLLASTLKPSHVQACCPPG